MRRRDWVCWLAVGATGMLPVTSTAASQAHSYFVGETAAGVVIVRVPKQPSMFMAFAAQVQPPSSLRITILSCISDEDCISDTVTAPGTLTLTGTKVNMSLTHSRLGKIDLSGPIEYDGPGQATCRAAWGTDDGDEHAFSYYAVGVLYRVKWSGRVGTGKAKSPQGFGCGRYQRPGVIDVSKS